LSGGVPARAAIVGLAGPALSDAERGLYRRLPPAGFILFRRNCEEPRQVADLTRDLRALLADRSVPVLIDQEGGRVMRLGPPHWPVLPAAARIGDLAGRAPKKGLEAARRLGEAIGGELSAVGIDVDCAPCLDLARPETTRAIGDRAFAADPSLVGRLGRAFMAGLSSAGVAPVIKHLPGHGRARVDSHHELPVVEAGLDELSASDLVPFRMCADSPFAMTAHLVYTGLDPERPATLSPMVIRDVIRGAIGFRGILISDDLGMSALTGDIGSRAARAVAAGCDLALECSGDPARAEAALRAVPALAEATAARLAQALPRPGAAAPVPEALARLDTLLAA
jgi:beta-N-acetylhexosaminidase